MTVNNQIKKCLPAITILLSSSLFLKYDSFQFFQSRNTVRILFDSPKHCKLPTKQTRQWTKLAKTSFKLINAIHKRSLTYLSCIQIFVFTLVSRHQTVVFNVISEVSKCPEIIKLNFFPLPFIFSIQRLLYSLWELLCSMAITHACARTIETLTTRSDWLR